MQTDQQKLKVFITSPLERVYVDQIAVLDKQLIDIGYEPDLLPPTRYVADHKGSEEFRRSPEQDARWFAHLSQADVLWDFPTLPNNIKNFYDIAPNVKWVQTTSSGVGQMVKNLGLQDSELLISTARGIHARPLADFVFSALLSHYKSHAHLKKEQSERRWERYCGESVSGKTLAVIGAGGVGKQVMAIGRAFGMRIVALASPGSRRTVEELGADHLYASGDLHDLLAEADALVLSMPHTPETENLIDRDAIASLKPGAALVNIARGQVVDEEAMTDALKSGHIGFAALDVFQVEPLPQESELWDLPNVLISPHSASTVDRENQIITDIFCHNLKCYLEGRTGDMNNILDKSRMY